jgi:hypothetical protein
MNVPEEIPSTQGFLLFDLALFYLISKYSNRISEIKVFTGLFHVSPRQR